MFAAETAALTRSQILVQATAVLAAMVYSGVVSFVLLKLIALVLPLRATASDEGVGLDIAAHGEEAYLHSDAGGRSTLSALEATPAQRRVDSLVSAPVSK